jgi:hypothetical protein
MGKKEKKKRYSDGATLSPYRGYPLFSRIGRLHAVEFSALRIAPRRDPKKP